MKYYFLPVASAVILALSSCQTKEQYLTKEELLKKSDSLISIRFKELKKQADLDLQYRMTIEVKPKVDSILNVLAHPDAAPVETSTNDTATKTRAMPINPVLFKLLKKQNNEMNQADSLLKK